jgi:DNA adenine methylase
MYRITIRGGYEMKPIIKWVGGKTQLLGHIHELMPPKWNKYFEPFCGGAALLLNLAPEKAFANDINPELINLYLQIREQVEDVINFLKHLDAAHESATDPKEFYYSVREGFNKNLNTNTPEQAARLIYLNKHCFNGLYRVNSKGYFNVPFNGKLTGSSFDEGHLRAVSKQIHSVEFSLGDFEQSLVNAESEDFVFFDSPYAALTPTSFTDYTKEGFSYDDHVRLAKVFRELSNKGVYCMLTNHDTELIRDLYKDYNIREVDVSRSINSKGNNRKGKELIITNYDPRNTSYEET